MGSPLEPIPSNIFYNAIMKNYGYNNVLYHLNHEFTQGM